MAFSLSFSPTFAAADRVAKKGEKADNFVKKKRMFDMFFFMSFYFKGVCYLLAPSY